MKNLTQQILEVFIDSPKLEIEKEDLRKRLAINDQLKSEWTKAIQTLLRDKVLYETTKRAKLYSRQSHKWIIGTLSMNPRGFGFVRHEESGESVFIKKNCIYDAMHGDLVLVKLEPSMEKGEFKTKEGRISTILERHQQKLVGEFREDSGFFWVVPDDIRVNRQIIVHNPPKEVKNHDKVVVSITHYPSQKKKTVKGQVEEVLGAKGEKQAELLSILKERDIPCEFSSAVLSEAGSLSLDITNTERKKRLDLTKVLVFTIDGADAKDLDDAISIKRLKNGRIELGVHIADVAHYVKEDSAIDKEALERATSVYLIDTVIPMLPEALSNHLCSLNTSGEKLALSVLMELDEHGNVHGHSFHESVLKSNYRLTYDEVNDYFDNRPSVQIDGSPELQESLLVMKRLANALSTKRHERGSIEFDFKEAKIKLDEEGKTTDISFYDRGISHRMIEECMLLCNETVARFFAEKEVPFVYRVHESPREERLEAFSTFVQSLGANWEVSPEPTPKELQEFLESVKDSSHAQTFQLLMLRSMMQARYSPECKGHFGLSSPYYSHFTSPIRRYPDLQIHRILKDHLAKRLTDRRKKDLEDRVEVSCRRSSERERVAEQAENEYKKLKKLEFMSDKIGETFTGMITNVTKTALSISLTNTVEGKALVFLMKDKNFAHHEDSYAWIGEEKQLRLGDEVKVTVREVNLAQKEIIFDVIFEEEGE